MAFTPRARVGLAAGTLLALVACTEASVVAPVPRDARRNVVSLATLTVTNTDDAGPGSLRDAVLSANATPGADVITFALGAPATIALATGELVITDPVTIDGVGAGVTVSGSGASRVFRLTNAGAVTIAGLTIANGLAAGSSGGCIQSNASRLTLDRVLVRNCLAQGAGGGVSASGFSNPGPELRVLASTIRDNRAWNGGGGIYVDAFIRAEVIGSTLSGNVAQREGGGLGTTGNVLVENSTVSGNSAWNHGGGLYAADRDAPGLRVRFTTVAFNTADFNADGTGDGGGIFASNATAVVEGSILAKNTDANSGASFASDCAAGGSDPRTRTITGSVVEVTAGCGGFAIATTTVADPLLAPLAVAPGATTATHAIGTGSPAIDRAAGLPSCPATDQRGLARPQGAACDAGAFEALFVRTVHIDVRPGSASNPVPLRGMGVLPVAILTEPGFDAATVTASSVQLGPLGATPLLSPDGTVRTSLEDVDGDGDVDLVLFFDVSSLGLLDTTTSLTLTGMAAGVPITGTDSVRPVP